MLLGVGAVGCGASTNRAAGASTTLGGAPPATSGADPVSSTAGGTSTTAPPTTTAPPSAGVTTTTLAPASVNLSGQPTAYPVTLKPPSTVSIPSIGITSPVIPLGRAADGTAQVPATTTVVGWYDDGPIPGEPGPAVLLGHVDSYTGPAIFFRLRQLTAGAVVNVVDGPVTVMFQVQSVQSFDKDQFPTSAVYGPTPARALRLITCGGPFDAATGHYLENVVVFATEVATSG